MSYAHNHRKKEIKRQKRDRLATIGLFGDIGGIGSTDGDGNLIKSNG